MDGEASALSGADQDGWAPLTGFKADADSFPQRARLLGEGIIIFRTKNGFRGVERACPHMKATMMEGELTANDSMLRCPLHVFTFRLSDGKGVNCPGFRLRVFEIHEDAGQFLARPVS